MDGRVRSLYVLFSCLVYSLCVRLVGSCLVSDICLLFAEYVRLFSSLVVRWDFYYSVRPEVWRLYHCAAESCQGVIFVYIPSFNINCYEVRI